LSQLSEAVEQAGGELGYDVLVHCNYQRDVAQTYEFLNGGMADGLLFFGPTAGEPLLPLLRSSSLPTVLVGPRYTETQLSSVTDDEERGMELIADALVERGHTLIGAIVDEADGVVDPTGRVSRLKAALANRGVDVQKENVIVLRGTPAEAVEALVSLPNRPTALFVWHDRTAYLIVEALEARGLTVPDDLSVVGYDGIVWPSTSTHVVATVKVPIVEMAATAVAFLNRLVDGELGPLTQTLPVQFSPGTTLGLPAKQH